MLSILNRALSWAITSFGNKFNLKKRSRLIKAVDNRFYVKFMQLEIGLLEARNSLVFILVIYPIELMVKLEENLSLTRYFPWKASGQYRAYLGFPERFGHFLGLK